MTSRRSVSLRSKSRTSRARTTSSRPSLGPPSAWHPTSRQRRVSWTAPRRFSLACGETSMLALDAKRAVQGYGCAPRLAPRSLTCRAVCAPQHQRKGAKASKADQPPSAQQAGQHASGTPPPRKKGREAKHPAKTSQRAGQGDAVRDDMNAAAKAQRNAGSKAACSAPLRKRGRPVNSSQVADENGEGSGGDFKENAGKQTPAITTRHLQVGERSFVCKVINTPSGIKRMREALQDRPLLAWRLAFKHRVADGSSDDEDEDGDVPSADPVLAGCTNSGERPGVHDGDEHVLGMALASSADHCWFVSAAAFRSPREFWDVCALVLTSGQAIKATYACQRVLLTLLQQGIDLAACSGYGVAGGAGHEGGTCRLWDVAVAAWAVEDVGPRSEAKGCARGTAGSRAKAGKKGKGKGTKKGKTMSAADSGKSLHQACLLHAPTVAGTGGACLCALH